MFTKIKKWLEMQEVMSTQVDCIHENLHEAMDALWQELEDINERLEIMENEQDEISKSINDLLATMQKDRVEREKKYAQYEKEIAELSMSSRVTSFDTSPNPTSSKVTG